MELFKRVFATKSKRSSEPERAYEAFVRTAVISRKRISYYMICRRLGISRKALDEIVQRELGMSGRELLRAYRHGLSSRWR